ncbi:F-box only protein 4 [Aplochiton taeniatus]
MTLLSPADLCSLGATSRYWRVVVRDPLLWRYFLLRDMPFWTSIDHNSMPHVGALSVPLCEGNLMMEDSELREGTQHDFMSDYLKGCPECRQRWMSQRPPYGTVTSFLQSLVSSFEPRYAMIGPGMEQLEVSMVTRLMHSPDILPVAGISQRQINGIGSGISYMYKNQHKFNILTLYSTNRAERERARVAQQSVTNKLFTLAGTDQSGWQIFSAAPQVQEVCQAVDGFIYVANAELGRGEAEMEAGQIRALVDPAWGSTSRPVLVLSCVSRDTPVPSSGTSRSRTKIRTSCVDMANRLRLTQLPNPWMVQDTVAESLSGLLDGISWLLSCSGVRL